MSLKFQEASNQKTLREIIEAMDNNSKQNSAGQTPQWAKSVIRSKTCPNHGTNLDVVLPVNTKFIVEKCCNTFHRLVGLVVAES
jgi:hypothetical protein